MGIFERENEIFLGLGISMDWKRFEKVKEQRKRLRKARFLKFSAKFYPFVKEIQVLKPGKLIIKDKAEIPEDFLLGRGRRATINAALDAHSVFQEIEIHKP